MAASVSKASRPTMLEDSFGSRVIRSIPGVMYFWMWVIDDRPPQAMILSMFCGV